VDKLGNIVWQYGEMGIAGSGPNQLNTPVCAVYLPSGNILITDQGNHRVIEVNQHNLVLWQYGTTGVSGAGANQLNDPNSAELLDNGHILIADEGNNRVLEVAQDQSIAWHYGDPADTTILNGPAFASRSDDYGGFRRTMTDAALAQNDLGGVQFAEVAVDTETGIVRVERVVAVQDCGRPMNPLQIESQVQGGVLMGISYALFEDRIIDRHTGHMLNADLEHYKFAGPRETPEIEVLLLENYQGQSSTDAYGIAEPANIAAGRASRIRDVAITVQPRRRHSPGLRFAGDLYPR